MQAWDIYEITTSETSIKGVMFRGRIRKFALHNKIELLTENASDAENTVRFAIHHGRDVEQVREFIVSIASDANVELVREEILNPVLSKLKVNQEERYEI